MFAKSLISLSFFLALSAPVLVFATSPAGLVPCGTQSSTASGDDKVTNPCGFNDIITLVQKGINFLIQLGVILAALGFAYAGFLYITAMGSEEKIHHAHSIFLKVIWGFVFMLSAWLIVRVLETTFLTTDQQKRSFLSAPTDTKVVVPPPADVMNIN